MGELADRSSYQLGGRVAEQLGEGTVAAENLAARILVGNADRRLFEGVPIKRLDLAKLALCGDQIGAVANRAHEACHALEGDYSLSQVAEFAVSRRRAVVELHRARRRAELFPALLEAFPV